MRKKLLLLTSLAMGLLVANAQEPVSAWSFNESTAQGTGSAPIEGAMVGTTATQSYDGSIALAFNGVDAFVDFGDKLGGSFTDSVFSISLWAQPTATKDNDGEDAVIFAKWTTADVAKSFVLWLNKFETPFGSISFTLPALNKWHHYVVLQTKDALSVYIDNKMVGMVTTFGYQVSTAPLLLGGLANEHNSFAGKMDNVAVYDRAITIKEIDSLYKSLPKLISFNAFDMVLAKDSTQQAKGKSDPNTYFADFYSFKSLDSKIASVNDTGLVKGVKPGITQIVASTGNGVYFDTLEVRVNDNSIFTYFDFNDGKAIDLSFNNNDGTITDNAPATTSRFGEPNAALAFSAKSQSVGISNYTIDGSQFTYTAWIKVNEFQNVSPYISSIMGIENGVYAALLRLGDISLANNKLQFATSTNTFKLDGVTELQTNRYYHVAVTCDGAMAKIFVNGKLDASAALAASVYAMGDFQIAAMNGDRGLNGTIDEVRVYKRALSETQIDSLFKIVPPITKFAIGDLLLAKDSTKALKFTVEPVYNLKDFADLKVLDPSIISIDAQGVVTGLKVGKTQIVFSTLNGTLSDTCTVRVINEKIVANFKDGKTTDNSGNELNATAVQLGKTTNRFLQKDSAFKFLVDGEALKIANDSLLNPKHITLAAWYKPSSFAGSGQDAIIEKAFTSNVEPYYQYQLWVCGNEYANDDYKGSFGFQMTTKDNKSVNINTEANSWKPGNWYFVLATYDGQNAKLFVNGKLYAQTDCSGDLAAYQTDLYIGKHGNTDKSLRGTIDETSIYGYALAYKQIDSLYKLMPKITTFSIADMTMKKDSSAMLDITINPFYDLSEFVKVKSLNPDVASANDTGLVTAHKFGIAQIVVSSINDTLTDTCFVRIPTTDGMAAYYPFNNNANDESFNGNDATTSNVSYGADRFGVPNSAAQFPATSAYVQGKSFKFGGAFSASAWVNCENTIANYARIFDFGDGQANNNIVFTLLETSGKLSGETFAGANSGGLKVNTTTAIDSNKWTHLVYVNSNDGKASIYVNGVLAATADQKKIDTLTRAYHYFGKSLWAGDDAFKGKLDDIYLSNSVFSTKQIDSLFKITPNVKTFTLADTSLQKNQSIQLHVKTDLGYDFSSFVTYKSLNPEIAAVNDSGKLVGKLVGNTKIIVTTFNGTRTDTCSVSVGDDKFVAYYPFNSNAEDVSNNGNGAKINNVSYTTDRFGVANSAIEFPKTGGSVQGKSFKIGGAFSMAAWINCKDTASFFARIFDFGNGSGTDNLLFGLHNKSGKLFGEVYQGNVGGGEDKVIKTPSAIDANKWIHVAYVNDGAGKGTIYVNGQVAVSGDQKLVDTLTRKFHYFGKSLWDADGKFEGKMDDIYLSNAIFTEKMVDSLFKIMPKTTSFAIDPALVLQVDSLRKTKLKVTPFYDLSQFVSYVSEDPSIASVDNKGIIKAHKVGAVNIIASTINKTFTSTCLVSVVDSLIYPDKVKLDVDTIKLLDNKSYTFKPSFEPEVISATTVRYLSTDTTIAIVSASGKVTALASGVCSIIAYRVANKQISDTCTIIVKGQLIAYYPFTGDANNAIANSHNGVINKAERVQGIDGLPNSAYHFNGINQSIMVEGALPQKNFTYTAWVKPEFAECKQNQYIISANSGDTSDVIHLGFINNQFSAGFVEKGTKNTVSKKIIKNNKWYFVSAVKQADSMSIFVNGKKVQTSYNLPKVISKANPKFSIGANTDYSYNEWFKGSIDELRIYSDALSNKEIDSLFWVNIITMGLTDSAYVAKDSSTQLAIKMNPDVDWTHNARFESTNASIVSIDTLARVKGISKGVAKVYGWFNNRKDSCMVTVTDFVDVSSIVLEAKSVLMIANDSRKLNSEVLPKEATNKTLKYLSSNENVAIVSETGVVTAIAPGSTVITVSSKSNPSIVASCIVTVSARTEVDENLFDAMVISPNPAHSEITVNCSQTIESLDVLTLQGSPLVSVQNSNKLSVSSLLPGVYLLNIVTDKGTNVQKLIVQ